jgi:predicted lipoprotein with Yx(FWY)xxD motif
MNPKRGARALRVNIHARRLVAALMPILWSAAATATPIGSGGVLTDRDGYTLYTFDYDQANRSNCSRECLKGWTPLRASAADRPSGRLSIVERANGDLQWALDARPLYLFDGDLRPGDVSGERLGWAWHAVRGYPIPSLLDTPLTKATESSSNVVGGPQASDFSVRFSNPKHQ